MPCGFESRLSHQNFIMNKNIIEKYSSILDDTKFLKDSNFIFMNDGYVELDDFGFPIDEENFILNEKNKIWKYQANLYFKSLQFGGFKPNQVYGTILDLSCGRGGGLNFIQENFSFKKLIGIDLTPFNIEFCKEWLSNVDLYNCSATELCLEDGSVDVITSIEASGYYEPNEDYVKEVFRVLKPKGTLIQVSPHLKENLELKFKNFKIYNFSEIYFKDITKNVRVSAAISKYLFRNFSEELFKLYYNDELRYIQDNTLYNIAVFKK